MTWSNGNKLCQEAGAHLPILDTLGEMEFLYAILDDGYWIGLTNDYDIVNEYLFDIFNVIELKVSSILTIRF